MRGYYTVDQVRAAEAELFTRTADGVPMRRAAFGLHVAIARELRERTGGIAGRSATLLVGSGDNGGDALFAGAFLARRGVAVGALLLAPERTHRPGLAALRRSGGRVVSSLGSPDLVVDGIVGISGSGPLREAAAELVAQIEAPIVAVDLPSGVDPDTGAIDGPAVHADVTVTFGAYKPVHALAAGACGRVELVDIGLRLPEAHIAAMEPADVGELWPVPGSGDHKYSQGVTAIVAGSTQYRGAAVLSVAGALRATSGMVRYFGPVFNEVLARYPEVVAHQDFPDDSSFDSLVVGPGIGRDERALERLKDALAQPVPAVVDADGLTLLATHRELVRDRAAATVVTPHDGEFARLAGRKVGSDRAAAATTLAEELGVTVLLKGRATVIASPGRQVLINEAGGSWAATAGSGDTLSGIIGALLAAGIEPRTAAAAAARVHSLAANLAAQNSPIGASDLVAHISDAIRVVRGIRDTIFL